MARPAAESLNRTHRPIAGSGLFRLAAVITVIGAAMWVYALATRPEAPPPPPTPTGVSTPATPSSLAPRGERAAAAEPVEQRHRIIDRSAPATFRLGVSFIAGFLIAFVARKFLKFTLFVGGILALVVLGMKMAGTLPMSVDVDALDSSVHKGVDWAKQEAGAVQKFLTGYVPSYFAAVVGGIVGFKRG